VRVKKKLKLRTISTESKFNKKNGKIQIMDKKHAKYFQTLFNTHQFVPKLGEPIKVEPVCPQTGSTD
jgi:hypothetical protein